MKLTDLLKLVSEIDTQEGRLYYQGGVIYLSCEMSPRKRLTPESAEEILQRENRFVA